VKAIHRLMIAVVAVLLLWAGLAYQLSRPQDASGYLRTALQVAASAHDAAATGALVGRQQLDGHLTDAFATTAYDDTLRAVSGAQKKLAAALPPDDPSTSLRDRLAPLVQATAWDLSKAATASDEEALRDAVDALDDTTQQLNDLMEEHQ
jgi:hypothetical protein